MPKLDQHAQLTACWMGPKHLVEDRHPITTVDVAVRLKSRIAGQLSRQPRDTLGINEFVG